MTKIFRLKKEVKYLGMILVSFSLPLFASSMVFFLADLPKHVKGEHSAAITSGISVVGFGLMLLLSTYIWAAFHTEKFSIDGTMLSIQSLFKNRQFDATDIECLKWRIRPMGGSIHFRILGSVVRLELGLYSKQDKLGIILAIRDLVPLETQEGWAVFYQDLALPRREDKPTANN